MLTKLAKMCGYKLPTSVQNFMERHLPEVKILHKKLRVTTPCSCAALAATQLGLNVADDH